MKKIMIMGLITVAFLVTGNFLYAQQPSRSWQCPHASENMQKDNSYTQQGWYCPWRSQSMGGGMMHHKGHGHGMMQGGTGPCMNQGSAQAPAQPLTKEEAVILLNDHLKNINNPNLKLGDVTEKDQYYEAEIVTKKESSLVDKIQVDKSTGFFRSAY